MPGYCVKYIMIYIKDYKLYKPNRNFYGLSAKDAYALELECLKRVQNHNYMCQLVDYNIENMTLDLAWAGQTFNYNIELERQRRLGIAVDTTSKTKSITQNDFNIQFDKAFDILESLDIVHLDLGLNNICIDQGKICIIDFGCSVIDGNVKTRQFEKLYNEFIKLGGYSNLKKRLLSTFPWRQMFLP